MQNIKKIQKAELKFIEYLQKMYLSHPEWSLDDFKDIYNEFIKFSKKINSDETSLLRKGEIILKDDRDTIKNILNMSLTQRQWYLFNIITSQELNISVSIIIFGTICKLTIEDTTDLENLL